MNFYNHADKSVFKVLLLVALLKVSLFCAAIIALCVVEPLNPIAQYTTNKSTFEYAFITIIVKVHLLNLLQT